MNIFDTLAENQITAWEKRCSEGKVKPSSEQKTTRNTLENQLFRDIEDIYIKMTLLDNTSAEWQTLDTKAQALKTQLLLSMERQGLLITSKNMAKSIYQKRQEILG